MIIEISYTYQKDKHSEVEHSWTYFRTEKEDFIKDAEKYFKSFIRANGWTKLAKLNEISVIKNETTPFPTIRVAAEPKPKRTRSKRTSKKSTSSSPSSKKSSRSQSKT